MRFLLLAPVLLLSACDVLYRSGAATDRPDTYEDYLEERERRIEQVEAAIGEATAPTVGACETVAVGAKACGGPAEYRVYSTTDGDTRLIRSRAEAVTALDAYANTTFGLASDCAFVSPPEVALEGGRCVAAGN